MAHNHAARKGEDSFSGASRFDVDDLVVNLLFDKSTKRKNELNEIGVFCDTTYLYKRVLKHVSTGWLSLEKAVSRTLPGNIPALEKLSLIFVQKQPRFKWPTK